MVQEARMTWTIHTGDCLVTLRAMLDNSVDSIVTDPPYGLAFMGKRWDYDVPSVEIWEECLRVLKPGGHLLAFAGTRTQHRMAVRIEDAGFEIRDMIAWVYGSGFPKSLDVSKAIDKAAGAEREVVGSKIGRPGYSMSTTMAERNALSSQGLSDPEAECAITAPATPEARQWSGWGTALKPALEPITVARKPLDGTVAGNVLEWGTGGLNVDGCRVGTGKDKGVWPVTQRRHNDVAWAVQPVETDTTLGRWPANLIHDGSEEVVGLFPETGVSHGGGGTKSPGKNGICGSFQGHTYGKTLGFGDSGSAARFFYCAKASKADRNAGCDDLPERSAGECVDREEGSAGMDSPRTGAGRTSGSRNSHPTVKPTALMRYLCRLVTPPGGVVLDPFAGSGSTGRGAVLEGFRFVGCELDPDYAEIARARIAHAAREAEDSAAQEPPQLSLLDT
jgi:DNA modification methylase